MKAISCSVPQAIEATGLGRSTLFEKIKSGELESVKVGKRRLILVPSLERLIVGSGQDVQ